jgi:FkbM family methyltransferase
MPTPTTASSLPEADSRAFLWYYAVRKRLRRQSVFCLQVGANDGVTNDPMNPYLQHWNWSGLLVEPQVDVFANGLQSTYRDNPRVILENVALAPEAGTLPFYRVAISDARWATGLSGFVRETIEKHIANGYIERKARADGIELPEDPDEIVEVLEVPTVTVDELVAKHGIASLDVVCIDTEGYDYEILKLVDLARLSPDVVLFESKNLSAEDTDAVHTLLRSHGYTLFRDGGDTLATRVPFPAATRRAVDRALALRTAVGPLRRRARHVRGRLVARRS